MRFEFHEVLGAAGLIASAFFAFTGAGFETFGAGLIVLGLAWACGFEFAAFLRPAPGLAPPRFDFMSVISKPSGMSLPMRRV
jgi:hypothetical protein